MVRIALLTATLHLVGCATSPAESPEPLSVDQILSETAPADTYGEPKRCLRPSEYRRIEILDSAHLLFWGSRDRVWLNRLSFPCVGLRPRATLRFDLVTDRICHLDSVTAIEESFRFWRRASATCGLGEFEPIAVEQANALKAALDR